VGTPSEAVVLVDLLCLLVDGDLATVLHNDVGGARLRALASAIQARAIVHRHLGCLDLLVPRDQRLLRGVVEEGLREARGGEASGVVRVLRWDRPATLVAAISLAGSIREDVHQIAVLAAEALRVSRIEAFCALAGDGLGRAQGSRGRRLDHDLVTRLRHRCKIHGRRLGAAVATGEADRDRLVRELHVVVIVLTGAL